MKKCKMFREPIGSFQVASIDLETQEIGNGTMKRRLMFTIFYPLDKDNCFAKEEAGISCNKKQQKKKSVLGKLLQ